MRDLVLTDGCIIDPATGRDETADIAFGAIQRGPYGVLAGLLQKSRAFVFPYQRFESISIQRGVTRELVLVGSCA